jgi:hypothetical protein
VSDLRVDPLDPALRAYFERRYGVDLSHVRVLAGSIAGDIARARDADALTIGDTGLVVLGGSPDRAPGSAAGRALLAHELVHVVQARVSDGRPFDATDEAAAEQVERQILAEAAPAPATTQRPDRDAVIAAITARVLELAIEALHADRLRNG